MVARLRDALSYGTVTGIFYFLFGSQLSTWDILGVNAFGFLFNLAGANLRHSEIWIHFGRLEPWLISPAAHQIHHSQDPLHYDKNFGVCLAIWDRWWGTHYDPRKVMTRLHFGLKDSPLSAPEQKIGTLYGEPLRQLGRLLWRAKT
jgi:sterol desaturase/sphingolipid hydroxylase (fatty acid hydroxylase superfamily)